MTSNQLFNLIDKADDKFLKEAMEDEAEYPVQMINIAAQKRRSPFKKIALSVTACAVAVGIAFGAFTLSGELNIPALFGGSKNIVLQKDGLGNRNSVLLKNFEVHEDWLKDHPEKALELRGSADDEYITVSAEMMVTFADWDNVREDTVLMNVRILADGKPIKYLQLNDYLYYNYDEAIKIGVDPDLVFENHLRQYREGSNYGYAFSKDIPEKDYDEFNRTYPSPIAFDVKKGTRQITVIAEFAADPTAKKVGRFNIEEDGCYYTRWEDFDVYSDITAATYSVEAILNGTADKIYSFSPSGSGTFSSEKSEFDTERGAVRLTTSGRQLTVNTDGLSADIPYYLMALLDGEPLLDGEEPLLIDPKTQNKTSFNIPERLIKRDGDEKSLRLLAIPVLNGEKYSDGAVVSAPVSEKYIFTAGKPTEEYFINKDLLEEFDGENFDSLFDWDYETLLTIASDKKKYTRGEPISVKIRFDNLSEKPVEFMQYITTDPYGTEEVISPIIAELMEQEPTYGMKCDLDNAKLSEQSLILEPGETYYKEFVIDSSLIPTENTKYWIDTACSTPIHDIGMFVDIEING